MGILGSLCTFQLLLIKRLDALSKSHGAAPDPFFKQNFIKKFACSKIFISIDGILVKTFSSQTISTRGFTSGALINRPPSVEILPRHFSFLFSLVFARIDPIIDSWQERCTSQLFEVLIDRLMMSLCLKLQYLQIR